MLSVSLLVFAALSLPGETSPALEDFFTEFSRRRVGIQSVRAEYEETNLLPDETFTTRGKILYIKPGRIIRHTQEPASTILMDRRTGYLYEPELSQLQLFRIEEDPQSDILFLGFEDDVRGLQEAYDVRLLEQDGRKGLLITPKFNPYRDPLFEEMSILFEGEHLLPARVEVVNDDSSKTIYTVGNYQVNGEIDAAESQIALAEGTTIVENNEIRERVGAGGKLVPAPLLPGTVPLPASPEESEPQIRVRELTPLLPMDSSAGSEP